MPYTKEQIRQKAYALEAAGAPPQDIEKFVRLATQEAGIFPVVPKEKGMLRQIAEGVVRPVAEVAVSGVNALDATGKLIRGDVRGANQALKSKRDVLGLGETKAAFTGDETFGEGVKKIAGYGLDVGSNVVGGGGAVNVAKSGLKGLVRQGAKQGAKSGALAGVMYGSGSTLEQGGTLGQAAVDGIKGGVLGGITGGVIGGTTAATSAVARSTKKFFKPSLDEAKQAYREALNFGKAELKRFDSPEKVEELVDLFVEEQVPIFTQDKGAKFATKGEPVAVLKNRADEIENSLQEVLQEFKGSKQIDLERVRLDAKRQIKNSGELAADTLNKRTKYVDELIDQEIQLHGRIIDPPTANGIKRGFWNLGYDLTAAEKNKSARYLGSSLRESVEKTVDGNEIVRNLNKRSGLLQEGIDVLENLDGKAVRGGKLGTMFNRVVGSVVGGKFGPLGSVAGSEVAARFSQFVADPERITETSIRSMQRSGFLPKSIKTIQEAKDFVLRVREQRASTLALPEPAIRIPERMSSQSGIIPNAPAPKVLPVEPRPGQFVLPPGRSPNEIPIPMREPTQYDKQTLPKNFIEGKIVEPTMTKKPKLKLKKTAEDTLVEKAKKYKSAEEFKKSQKIVYHGSPVPLKSFSNKKGGVFFTEEYADATGFAGSPDNVYEGYLNFDKPLVIEANGAKWDKLNTKYGKSTQEVISNAKKDGYDGVIFKDIIDNVADDAESGLPGTIYYAYKPKDAFLNDSQVKDIWNQANKKPKLPRKK